MHPRSLVGPTIVLAVACVVTWKCYPLIHGSSPDRGDQTAEDRGTGDRVTARDERLDIVTQLADSIREFDERTPIMSGRQEESDEYTRWRDLEAGAPTQDILITLVFAGSKARLGSIVHSRDLNPRGARLTNSQIGALESVATQYHRHIREAIQFGGTVKMEELRALHGSGELRRVSEAATDGRLATEIQEYVAREQSRGAKYGRLAESRARDPRAMLGRLGYVEYNVDRERYYAKSGQLTNYKEALGYRVFRGQEFAHALVAWHASQGLLTADEGKALRDRIDGLAARSPALRR
jgi:hypothetical protein